MLALLTASCQGFVAVGAPSTVALQRAAAPQANLNEHNIGNLHEIETGIYICFLVEYGIVDSYDELVRFLS